MKCNICGYENRSIDYHIVNTHGLTKLEYKTKYSDVDNYIRISNIVKNSWSKNSNNNDVYTLDETIELLAPIYKSYFGTGKNRTLKKYDLKLYNSIIKYSEPMVSVFKSQRTDKGLYVFSYKLKFIVEYLGDVDRLKCMCGRKYNFTGLCRYCPADRSNSKGRVHTPQSLLKMRLSTLKYLSTMKGQFAPRYNVNSIPIIEKYGIDNGLNFMHAENGGEFYIKELGYYVDAYDPINNVVLEIDEKHHFKNNKLSDRDVRREYEITKLLNCKFIRIKYEGPIKI